MAKTQSAGWQKLVAGFPWFEGRDCYPIPAYSEYMPAPRLGISMYGDLDRLLFNEEDLFGWRVPEIGEEPAFSRILISSSTGIDPVIQPL